MLENSTSKGFAWSAIESFSLQGIRFFIGIVLARLLSPSDYGMIGMLTIFMVLGDLLINSGFGAALIQKKKPTEVDYSTVFYFNLLVSILVYGALYFASPSIAHFYNLPELERLTVFIAIPIVINAFCIVQSTKFMIELDFKTPAIIAIVSAVLQGFFGVYLANNGYGVWALVYSNITGVFIKCVLLWLASTWRPILVFSIDSFKELFSFGSKLVGVLFIDTFYTNIYPLIIGKFYSASTLGFYSRAEGYSRLPSGILTSLIYKVTFPVFCKAENDKVMFLEYKKMIGNVSFIIFPIMIFLMVLAKPLIICFITAKWLPCVVLLQILCLSAMWTPILEVNLSLIKALGKSNLLLKLELINKVFAIIVLLITIPKGIIVMCVGAVIVSAFTFLLNLYFSVHFLKQNIVKQLSVILPRLAIALIAGGVIYFVNLFIKQEFYQLIFGSLLGLFIYLVLSFLFKISSVQLLKNLVKK